MNTDTRGCLLGSNEVFVTGSLVTDEEQSALLGWVDGQYRNGKLLRNPQDPGAHSTPFRSASGRLTRLTGSSAQEERPAGQTLVWVPRVDERSVDQLPGEFWSIRERVVGLLGLSALEEDHYKGSFMSYIAPGTGVHQHRDDRLRINGEELLILRCNVLFRKPEEGGMPVVESREIDVPDLGMWAFFPTELVHSATPVGGSRFRGLLSFGFLVRFADLWRRCFRIAPVFAAEYGLDAGEAPRRSLIDQLRRASEAQGIGAGRLDLLEFILASGGDFTVQEAAEAIGRQPADTWGILRDLQRSNVVESHSSTRLARGKVMVL